MGGRQYPDLTFIIILAALSGQAPAQQAPSRPAGTPTRPNILLITVDDMNWDAPGCFGGRVPDITPNIDRLASEGIRFEHAHVTVAVCTPSRSVLLTGMYPHRSGVEGFQRVRPEVPTLSAVLREAGYLCGTIGKWLGQQETFKWSIYDFKDEHGEHSIGRRPEAFHHFVKDVIREADKSDQPFFIMANSHDPHRPFHGSVKDRRLFHVPGSAVPDPSRIYAPDEIEVPRFLPELPEIRTELAQYYSSVRRADDTVGAILQALRESGQEANTLVVFLSDNGMAFPFAKSNCYLNSTRTPWIVRWPGRIRPGSVDGNHLISGIDLMPTVLEAAGIAAPTPLDGRSLLPLLAGREQAGRDAVFTQYFHVHAGKTIYPMRCVQTRRYGYIFNPWSDGRRVYDAEPLSEMAFPAMQRAAGMDAAIRRRVEFLQHRCVEEFYDLEKDPTALNNLVADPSHAHAVVEMRQRLLKWMEQTSDAAIDAFRHRDSPAHLERFMRDYSDKANREIEELKEYEARTGYRF